MREREREREREQEREKLFILSDNELLLSLQAVPKRGERGPTVNICSESASPTLFTVLDKLDSHILTILGDLAQYEVQI